VGEENPSNFQAPPGYKAQKLPCQHLKISCFCISFTAPKKQQNPYNGVYLNLIKKEQCRYGQV
jgi:hypothetical protein